MNTLERFIQKGRKEGLDKGREEVKQKNHEFVRNLLLQTDFTIAKIASLSNVSEAFVQKVKSTLR